MAKEIKLDLKINDGDAAQSIGDIKTRLRELRNAMIQAGEGSAEFERLAMEAANLKEQMNQANDAVRNFTPDSLETVGNFAGKAAAGVQLVTGAMNLFGEQSEETEKALLKVQSAMAFAQGIQGVKDFGLALKGLFAVISANPVGALATLIAGLALEVGMLYKSYQDANSEVAKATRLAEEQKKITSDLVREYDREIMLLEAQGASEQEIIAVKKEKIEAMLLEAELSARASLQRVKEVQENDSVYESYLRVTEGMLRKIGMDEKADLIAAKIQMNKKERAQEDLDNFNEQIQQIKDLKAQYEVLNIEIEKANEADYQSYKEAQEKKTEAKKAEEEKQHTDLVKAQQLMTEELYAQMERENANMAASYERRKQLYLEDQERKRQLEERKVKLAQEAEMKQRKIDQMRKDFQIDTIKSILSIAADLTSKNAKAQKAIAAAMTAVDTYVGAQKAFASQIIPGDPTSVIRGYIAAGLAVAAGLARVKSILAVNEGSPTVSDSGGMGGGMGSLEFSSQPNINANQQPSTLLNEQGQVINQQTQQTPMYVAVTEIRETQQAVEAVELRSRF